MAEEPACSDVPKLVTTPSDRELAAQFRERLTAAIAPVIAIENEANDFGLQVGWAIGRNQFGRKQLMELTIFRPL